MHLELYDDDKLNILKFWDTSPSTGPSNSWTGAYLVVQRARARGVTAGLVHGLWPDNCDGTFKENCDSSRAYTGIASVSTSARGARTAVS